MYYYKFYYIKFTNLYNNECDCIFSFLYVCMKLESDVEIYRKVRWEKIR